MQSKRFRLILIDALVLLLLLSPMFAHAVDMFFVVKCASGTPEPKSYAASINDAPAITVPPHKGADGATYFVLASSTLPQGANVKIAVTASNDFGSAQRTYVVGVGAPAPLGDFQWVLTKP